MQVEVKLIINFNSNMLNVYNMLNFICAIYIGFGGGSFSLNATTYFNNVYIMAVK